MNPKCCGVESVLKQFNSFEYFYCGECKQEVKTSVDLPTMATPAPGSVQVNSDGFNLDWENELRELFRGNDFKILHFVILGNYATIFGPTTMNLRHYSLKNYKNVEDLRKVICKEFGL